ncbi:MAG TPA: zf-HC2 domain-containing protein [Candidatus Xenobia bacterium]|nr:zf-HC2 domain-containing protein [Candidatus Xenobia bacterium]
MNCFPEPTYAVFVDGELPPDEARRIEAHLLACGECRALVEALRAESRLLADLLQEVEPEVPPELVAPPARPRWMDFAWTTAVILGVAASAQAAYSWFSEVETVPGIGWLNPFSLGLQVQLFFASLFYLLREGASMLASLTATISALLVAIAFIAGVVLLRRWRQTPRFLLVTFSLLLVLGLAQPAAGVEHRAQKKGDIVIGENEVIDDTLVLHAEHITVDGTVTGNLFVFGGDLSLKGTVKGDLFAFAGNVRLKGTVEGNVFVFGGNTEVSGRVGNSVHAFAGNFLLPQGAEVGGDAISFAGAATVDGEIKRDLLSFAGATTIAGGVGRHVRTHTEALRVKSSARIGGDLKAVVDKQEKVEISPEATIGGKKGITVKPGTAARYKSPPFYMQITLGLGIVFLLGLFLRWLFPFLFSGVLNTAGDVGKAAGIGFAACVVPPVAALVLGIILIGIGILADVVLISILIPILMVVVWLLALYLSKLFVALSLGQVVFRREPGKPAPFVLPLLAGLVVVYIAINIPIIGGMLRFIVWILGLGIATLAAWRHYRRRAAA